MKLDRRIYLYILTAIVLIVMIWQFQSILLYLIVAAIISLIGRPILKLLGKVKIKDWDLPDALKALLTLVIIYGLFSMIFVIFIPRLLKQTESIERIDAETLQIGLAEPIASIQEFIKEYQFTEEDMSVEAYVKERVGSVLSSTRVSTIANAIVGFTGDLLIAVFSVTFIAFFFLKERNILHNSILVFTPKDYEDKVLTVITQVKKLLTRYFIGVIIEILLVGGLISIGLSILGVKNAIVIGFFAGLFNVIPYLGPIIGAVMGLILTVFGCLNLDFYAEVIPLVLKVLVVFGVVQLIDNFVFQPYIYSSSVKAHPLEIFLVILMAGTLAGVGGMIIAIPVYTILRVVAKEFFNQFKLVQSITKSI